MVVQNRCFRLFLNITTQTPQYKKTLLPLFCIEKKQKIFYEKSLLIAGIKKSFYLIAFYGCWPTEPTIPKIPLQQFVLLSMADEIIENIYMFLIITIYNFISVVYTMISPMQAILKLATFINSSTKTIIGLTCKILSRNTFTTQIHASVAKDLGLKKQGVLQALPVLDQRWADISIDFVSDIPLVNGINATCIIIGRLSKKRYHIPVSKEIKTEKLANLFIHHIQKLHGLPKVIISDCSISFVNNFLKFQCKRLDINMKLLIAGITRRTDKLNNLTELWNSILEYMSNTCKTITLTSYRQPTLLAITPNLRS